MNEQQQPKKYDPVDWCGSLIRVEQDKKGTVHIFRHPFETVFYSDEMEELILFINKYRSRPHPAPAQEPTHRIIHKPDENERKGCGDCEAESCSTVCMQWINEHDVAISAEAARKAREEVLLKFDEALLMAGYAGNHDADCNVIIIDAVGGGCYPATLLEHNLIKTIESLRHSTQDH